MTTTDLTELPAASGQDDQRASPTIPFRMTVLQNGLTLIVHEDHRHPLVATQLRFRVGSKDEPAGRTGFAHLFEHLMFKQSANRRGNWHATLQSLGGTGVNGTTGLDRTTYFQTVPVGALDHLLWMESDRMGHLMGGIDTATLSAEVEVVKNEKRQREGEPYGGMLEAILTTLYPAGHPYAHTVLGSFEDLDNATLQTAADWHRRWYGGSNAILVLAGDIAFDDALAWVEHWFGAIPAGTPVGAVTRWLPEVTQPRRLVLHDRVPHRRLHAVWISPPGAEVESTALAMLGRILCDGNHSRLVRRLVERDRLCLEIKAGQDGRAVSGEFAIAATLAPGAAMTAVEAAIGEELRDLLDRGPTQEELDRVRRANRAGFRRVLDDLGRVAEMLAANMQTYDAPDGHLAPVAFCDTASTDTIRGIARRWLDRPAALTLDVRPFTAIDATADPARRDTPPAILRTPVGRLPDMSRATLDNGLRVQIAHCPGAHGADIALLFDDGTDADPTGREGLSALSLDLLAGGSARYDRHALSATLAERGIHLATKMRADFSTLSMAMLKDEAPGALDLMADMLLGPTFDADEVRRRLDRRIAAARTQGLNPKAAARMAASRLMHGADSLLGRSSDGTVESLATLTRDAIVERHRDRLNPARAHLLIAGGFAHDEAIAMAERAFGRWVPSGRAPSRLDASRRPAPGRYRIDRPGSAQSALHIGLASDRLRIGDMAAAIFNQIFGGTFNSRLNVNLRERRGWTYGIGSGLSHSRTIGEFRIQTEVQGDRTLDALAEIEGELRALTGERPLLDDEIDAARDSMLVALPSRWVKTAAVVDAMVQSIVFDLPPDHFDRAEDRLRAVSADAIGEVIGLLGDPSGHCWVAAGDPAHLGGAGYATVDAFANRL
ncbi:pitrilysin family protein [Sphingomonas sp. VNH70]|uniref:M16 family metallopeptidase n=1 Tax=Sphingomonas silueang TaxID=3156617 RepID=UPI0032B4F290